MAFSVVKEQAAAADLSVLTADVGDLKAIKARHSPTTAALCEDYLAEKEAKAETERQRDEVRAALDQHRATAFPAYQTAINLSSSDSTLASGSTVLRRRTSGAVQSVRTTY